MRVEIPKLDRPRAAAVAASPAEFDLPSGALRGFDAKIGARVTSLRGLLWITQAGDATDYTLDAGESFKSASSGRVVVQALSAARVRIG